MGSNESVTEIESKPLNRYQYIQYFVAIFIILFSIWIDSSPEFSGWINSRVNHPVLFHVRELISKTPALSDKIKVFALDDETVRYIDRQSLDLYDFALLMKSISKKKPKAILLDRIFAGSVEKHPRYNEAFEILKSLDTPIYSGGFLSPVKMQYRTPLEMRSDYYSYKKYGVMDSEHLDFLKLSKQYAYGPSQEYISIFNGVGRIEYNDDGTVTPLTRMRNNKIFPHIAMYTADKVSIQNEKIVVDDQVLGLDRNNNMLVNYRPILDYYKSSSIKSMRHALKRARKNEAEPYVEQGDVVIVLFNFYTGNTDFIEVGPFGALPGGLFVTTVVDSIFSSNWLKPFGMQVVSILLLSFLGILIGRYTSTLSFWLLSLVLILVYLVTSIVLFSYFNIVIDWFIPAVSFLLVGGVFYTYRRLMTELDRIRLEAQYYLEKSKRLEEENKAIQLEERLNLGKAVQDILLPEKFDIDWSYVNVGIKYQPAQEMSGDWLYVWERDGERRFIIGDVVGKGPSAAIPVAVIIGILGECERLDLSMLDTVEILNKRIYKQFKKQITSTLAAACISEDRKIVLYNAGSPGWFQFGDDITKGTFLGLRSDPIGVNEKASCAFQELDLSKGSTVFTFTDGYLEGARALKKLIRFLEKKESYNVDVIHDALEEIGKDYRLVDDRSMLSVSIK